MIDKMTKEFNLSEKRSFEPIWQIGVYLEEDIKEFIKRLKHNAPHWLIRKIDKLSGDKLIS